jgi:Flp pilus assembly CpaE family ATPase
VTAIDLEAHLGLTADLPTPVAASAAPRMLVLAHGEELAGLVRYAYTGRSVTPEVVACASTRDLGTLLSEPTPFDVLLAGGSHADHRGLHRLRVIHEELPTMSVVLALAGPPAAGLRDVIRTGAVDLIELPSDPGSMATILDRAVALRRLVLLGAAAAGPSPAPGPTTLPPRPDLPPPPAPNLGAMAPLAPIVARASAPPAGPRTTSKVITIASASGGSGKTFLATNLAWYLATYTDQRVCIIDLDLQFGEVSSSLRLRPRYTISELIHHGGDHNTDLAPYLEEYTEVHDANVRVLAAPRDPVEADAIGPADVARVIDAARRCFDFVIVDTPPALADTVVVAFHRSDELFVMATVDVPSVRNMRVFLGTLDRLQIPKGDIRLLLNKAERNGVDARQLLSLFPQGFDGTLPYAREVNRSLNMGRAVMAVSPAADITRHMDGAFRRLLPTDAAARVDAAQGRRTWFRRKAS